MSRRLFVSIDLGPALQDAVAAVQAEFESISGIRTTDPSQAHVTLKFLGDVDEDKIDAVGEALQSAIDGAGVEPFEAEFGNFGVFPEFDYISVVWIGVPRGGIEMESLHLAIEEETVAMGFDEEAHHFTPHVTIARMEHGEGKDEVQEILRTEHPSVGEMEVSHVSLTESELTSEGPRYHTIERVSLAP